VTDENISLGIYDLKGDLMSIIYNDKVKSGANSFNYSTEGLSSGIYIIKANGETINQSAKVIIVK
jgi:hypothetical protein